MENYSMRKGRKISFLLKLLDEVGLLLEKIGVLAIRAFALATLLRLLYKIALQH